MRSTCAWPVLLGRKTLQKLRAADPAALQQRVKVSRREVRTLLATSTLASPVPFLWHRLWRP